MALEDSVAAVPLFQGCSKREIKAIVRSAKEVEFPEGKTIVSEGDEGVSFHLILEGTVSVTRGGRQLARLTPGSYFGEMALLDKAPRTATVVAETPVRTLALSAWDFHSLLDAHPGLSRKILAEVSRRLREHGESPSH